MTSVSDMIGRLNSIQRMYCHYSSDEIIRIEHLALMDEILTTLREITRQIALLKEVK